MPKRIDKVLIQRLPDGAADISYLGEYSDDAGGKYVIDRGEQRGEFRYFHAANVSNDKEAQENYKTAEAYDAGEWSMLGIRAVAIISTARGQNGPWKSDKLTSMGIWGVQSDSGDEYLDEQGQEQLDDLRSTLSEFGFDVATIDAAFAKVETVDAPAIPISEQFSMRDQ